MTDLEKRLIVLSSYGLVILHMDGHRWLYQMDGMDDYFDFNAECKKHGISINTKFYGGIVEVLDVIDRALEMMGQKSLLDSYWFDDAELLAHSKYGYNRIDREPVGRGGLS